MRRTTTIVILGALLGAAAPTGGVAEEQPPSAEGLELFRVEVLPILQARCFKCHGGGEHLKSHFRITSRAGLIRGGDRGPAIHLGEPGKSLLLAMISYRDEEHSMPPSGKLPEEEIATLTRWVELGAPFDPASEIHAPEGEEKGFDPTQVNERTRSYWAFRPVSRPPVPAVGDPSWRENPIDAFILARLAEKGLEPNPPATRRELIRRAYYDLIGLPPTLDEVRAFENDDSPDAFERVVARLLDSPHYGEKWARHWLDLVRYAESNGYERDSVKPMAWGYRDYVIRALNDDRPYDRFILEQLAGDELDDPTSDSITATGFHRLGLWDDEPVDREQARYDYLDSILSTTGEVMLGLTVGCARCHDHKIDPLPQKDYYRMLAFFANISPHGKGNTNLVRVAAPDAESKLAEALRAKSQREAALHEELRQIERDMLARVRERSPALVAGLADPPDMVDVRYRFYRDTWDSLPDFDALRPETEGALGGGRFSLAPALRRDAMGLVFEARLLVSVDGAYRFRVRARDGSRLRVGEEIVGEHSGTGAHEYDGVVELAAGHVPIRLDYFNRDGEPSLDVAWGQGGLESRPLSSSDDAPLALAADARRDANATWRYTFERPGESWTAPDFDANRWKQGPGGFGRRGASTSVVRTEWTSDEIWLRRDFEARGAVDGLTLTIQQEGEASVWINGTAIREWLTAEPAGYRAIELGEDAVALLREGRNVLAIHCRKTGEGQSIDVGLVVGTPEEGLPELIAARGAELLGQETRQRYFELATRLARSFLEEPELERREVMAVGERGQHAMHVLLRGNPALKGPEVGPGFPEVLSPPEPRIASVEGSSGRRRALAEWIVDPANPLTARVIVNRLWQFHFGRGLARSSSNFGRLGDRPTHPELLDWLATEIVRRGWSLKAMHRLMMLSRTYQMSSRGRPDALEKDPQNDLFWRFDMRRLTAEEIRDSILMVSGKLNPAMYGPSFFPVLPNEVLHTSSTGAGKWGKSPPAETFRRSIYIFIRRSLQDPMLKTFDFADTDSSCAVRFSTTVPSQALTMLNSQFVNEQAEYFAERVEREAATPADRVRRGFEIALSRSPTTEEVERGVALLEDLEQNLGLGSRDALARLCLLILNLNEFFFVD